MIKRITSMYFIYGKMRIEEYYIVSKSCCGEKTNLYFADWQSGLIICLDMKNQSYRAYNPLEDQMGRNLLLNHKVSAIKEQDDYLYLTYLDYNNYKNIVQYDLINLNYKVFGEILDNIHEKPYIKSSFIRNNRIFQIPLNIENNIEVFDILSERYVQSISFEKYGIGKEKVTNCIKINNCVWFGLIKTSVIISVDLNNNEVIIYKIPVEWGIESISSNEGDFWVSFIESDNILCWNPERGVIDYYRVSMFIKHERKQRIFGIVVFEEKVYCFSNSNNFVVIINKNTKFERRIDYPQRIKMIINIKRNNFETFYKYGTMVVLVPWAINCFLFLDIKNERIIAKSNLRIEDIYQEMLESTNGIVQEEMKNSLNEFLIILNRGYM